MDYASGKKYAWDAEHKTAREALLTDTLLLPTLSREEMANWRSEFSAEHGSTPELMHWKNNALTTNALPSGLQGVWNGFVRRKASERLIQWFSEKNISAEVFVSEKAVEARPADSVEELRKIVGACVSVMTLEELVEIKLPPRAVLRARIKGEFL
jgi:hypothetical protein